MKFTFNTGRGYSPVGQPITVCIQGGTAFFRDHARNIVGRISGAPAYGGQHTLSTFVLDNYDFGNYSDITYSQWDRIEAEVANEH